MNFEENSKLNVVINFQFLFFGIRIDQSIAFQLTKIPKGEDPSAEVPKRGGEERRDFAGFSVTSFKIHQNKNQNHSVNKVHNLRNERGTYTKTLAKIQGRGIFRIRDIRRNVSPKLVEISMETPCWCSPR